MKATYVLIFSSLLLAAGNAAAGDFYVLGAVGQSKVKDVNKSTLDADIGIGLPGLVSTFDDSGTGYKLQLGYQFNKNLALEGGYVNLGKATYSGTFTGGTIHSELKSQGWGLNVLGILPITEQFSVFGKLGAIHAQVKATLDCTGVSCGPTEESNWSGVYGLGASYALNKSLAIRAEYERYAKLGGDNVGGKSDVDLISVGLSFKF